MYILQGKPKIHDVSALPMSHIQQPLQRYHRADLECYPFQVTHPPHNHPLRLYVVMCTHPRVHRRSKAPSNLYDNRVMHALAYNVSYTHLVSTSSSCEPITFLTKIFSKGSAIVCEYCFIPLRLLPNLLRLLCSVLSHNIFEQNGSAICLADRTESFCFFC
jgi:hypothetical protein